MDEIQEGQTATNPKTGQRVVFRNGQWRNALATAPKPPTKQTAAEAKAALAARTAAQRVKGVERQLGDLEGLYSRDFKGFGPSSLLEYLPTPARKRFDAAATAMRPLLKPLIRDPGEGTFTDADQALLDSLIPSGGAQDAENEQRFKNIRAMIADRIREGQTLGGMPAATPSTIKRIR